MWIFVKIKKQLQLKEKIISYSENFSSAYIKEGKFIFQNGDEADAITSRFTQPQCRWEVHLQLNSFAFSLSGGERWEAVHLFNKDSLSDYHEPVSLGSEETTMNKRASSQHLLKDLLASSHSVFCINLNTSYLHKLLGHCVDEKLQRETT